MIKEISRELLLEAVREYHDSLRRDRLFAFDDEEAQDIQHKVDELVDIEGALVLGEIVEVVG